MTNYWAIAIGINQYRCFQPLMYAQRDAQALWGFWVNEGHFPQDHCLLLADSSPAIDQISAYPSRENIASSINRLCEQLQQDDFLWCFLSGYGVQFQGKDYFMPIEGDPARVAETGILIESLLTQLQAAPTDNILLVLDINRSQGVLDGGVGQETITLADRYAISTLLSCLPEQFSQETLALRHSLFTAALLEGLQLQGCSTLEQLARYVGDRVPQLCEHHWRPRQDPVTIIPDTKQYQLIVPTRVAVGVGGSQHTQYGQPPYKTTSSLTAYEELDSAALNYTEVTTNGSHPPGNGHISNGSMPQVTTSQSTTISPSVVKPPDAIQVEDELDDQFWQRWLPRLLGLISLLVLAVLIQNRSAFSNQPEAPPVAPGLPSGGASSGTAVSANPTAQMIQPAAPTQAGPSLGGTTQAGTLPANGTTLGLPPAQPAPDNSASLSAPATSAVGALTTASGSPAPSPALTPFLTYSAEPLESARAALRSQQYKEAARQLEKVPANQRTGDYAQLVQQTNQGLLLQARASLTRSRALTATNQASDFNTAIQLASAIKQGQPLYSEAQQEIDRWSYMILDLARSRASQSNRGSSLIAAQNYSSAISAAMLVPPNRPQLYTSSQQFIAQWGQTILTLARTRAAEGRLDTAIQTARLIPSETPAYSDAQQAIAQWRAQLGY